MKETRTQLISCPKCHGKGVYDVPVYDGDELKGYNPSLCGICGGVGKITIEQYEWLQEQCRGEGDIEI